MLFQVPSSQRKNCTSTLRIISHSAKSKISSFLSRKRHNNSSLPFVHRDLERTFYLPRQSPSNIAHKKRSSIKTPVLMRSVIKERIPLYHETIQIPSQFSKIEVLCYLSKNIESINNKLRNRSIETKRQREVKRQLLLKRQLRKKQHSAAIIIQRAVRKWSDKKRYNEYIRKYKESQRRIMAAMKIQ